jgi:hypothetical protein
MFNPDQPRDDHGRWGEGKGEENLNSLPEKQYSDEQKSAGLGGRGGDVNAGDVFDQPHANVLFGTPKETSKLWTRTLVDVRDLIPTQNYIPREGLRAYMKAPPKGRPEVVSENGKLYITAGHTRIGAQILGGARFVTVNLVDFDGKKFVKGHP